MFRICETVQEADRYRLNSLGCKLIDRGYDAAFIEFEENLALGIDPLPDRQATPARNERLRQVDVDVILLESIFMADLDDIPEAFGGEQRCLGAFSFDQRIRRQGCSVDDDGHCTWFGACFGDDGVHRGQHPFLRRA
jgi:hypothetical protein